MVFVNTSLAGPTFTPTPLTGTGGRLAADDAKRDAIDGGAGDDRLFGQGGNDTVNGGSGNDLIAGGLGTDLLFGEGGRDIFDFNAPLESKRGGARDVIQDFARGDRIDLSTIDADTSANPGNDKFAFIGGQAFHGGGGEVRFAGGILQGDTNGNRVADFEIKVNGVSSLAVGDLFL